MSIAIEFEPCQVHACDVSAEALEYARRNVDAAGAADVVSLYQGDLGAAIPAQLAGAFDCIVSNPPYIPDQLMGKLPQEVAAYEPTLALDGGADGLEVFHRLIPWAAASLKPGGLFACELFEESLDAALEIAFAVGFSSAEIKQDLTGRPRYLVAYR